MCLGKRKGGLKFSDCIGQVAVDIISHFLYKCTLSCTRNTHSHAASQGRSYQFTSLWLWQEMSVNLSKSSPMHCSGVSQKSLGWAQGQVSNWASCGARCAPHWLRAALCCSEALLAIFAFVRRLTSPPPLVRSLPNHCCRVTAAVHSIYPVSNALPNICHIFSLFSPKSR